MAEGLQVQLAVFEGPLDLLLHLIRREEINIYDIPIAQITEQYLEYIADLSSLEVERASEFLVMAATLLRIKSQMLLPKPPPVELPEEEEVEDPRAELVRQLLEYQQFKEAAAHLKQLEQNQARCYPRGYQGGPTFEPPLEGLAIDDLIAAFEALLAEEWHWREVPREEIPLREKVRQIQFWLGRSPGGIRFSELFDRGGSRLEVVVTFLALLELIRQRQVLAYQNETFGEIYIKQAPGSEGGE